MNEVIEKIQKDIAAEYGCQDWFSVMAFASVEQALEASDKYAHRLAEHCCKEQRKACRDNYREGYGVMTTPLSSDKYKP